LINWEWKQQGAAEWKKYTEASVKISEQKLRWNNE
jgi:hypothetical protein